MPPKYLLFLLLPALMASGCRKNQPAGNPAYVLSLNPTNYELTSIVWSGPSTNGQSFLFSYDSVSHLLSDYRRVQWGTGTDGSGQTTIFHDTDYYHLSYSNGLVSRMTGTSATGWNGYFQYEYNDKGWPTRKSTHYSTGALEEYETYAYDTRGNMILATDIEANSGRVDFKYFYSYDSAGNLLSIMDSILWSSPQQKNLFTFDKVDDKVNYLKAINGWPGDWNVEEYPLSAPHNILQQSWWFPTNLDQPSGTPDISQFAYQYNDAGLPTQMITVAWTVNFTYARFR